MEDNRRWRSYIRFVRVSASVTIMIGVIAVAAGDVLLGLVLVVGASGGLAIAEALARKGP